jgi:hypothetical protein
MTPPSRSSAKKARETTLHVAEAWKLLATHKKEIEATHLRDLQLNEPINPPLSRDEKQLSREFLRTR